jgi:hypothetical protein
MIYLTRLLKKWSELVKADWLKRNFEDLIREDNENAFILKGNAAGCFCGSCRARFCEKASKQGVLNCYVELRGQIAEILIYTRILAISPSMSTSKKRKLFAIEEEETDFQPEEQQEDQDKQLSADRECANHMLQLGNGTLNDSYWGKFADVKIAQIEMDKECFVNTC